MEILHNFSLKNYNTFGIEASAKQFVNVQNLTELKSILEQHPSEKKFILGGGSNMLLTQNIVRQEKTGMNLFFGQSTKILAD
mgnify:CR=1 FL=1